MNAAESWIRANFVYTFFVAGESKIGRGFKFNVQLKLVSGADPYEGVAFWDDLKTNFVFFAIAKDGTVYLDGQTITMEEVGASVKKIQDEKRPVGLKVDEEAPVKRMFEVLDSLKLAGVQSLPAFTREKSR